MSINVCNDRSMASITSLPSGVSGSSLVLISEQTASSSSTIDFTSGIDSTYKEYQFHFTDIHPATDNVDFMVLFRDGSSAFDATGLAYNTGMDLAQATSGQKLIEDQGNDNDQCGSGILHLFDPSSTTFVKHFIARTRNTHHGDYTADEFVAGYINTTTALDKITFYFSSGNQAGTIKMYGVK